MKTNQVLESVDREILGSVIRQRTKDEYFALADIINFINLYKVTELKQKPINFSKFRALENVKAFVAELQTELPEGQEVIYNGNRASPGWVHPYFALKILTHFNPKLEVKVYKWLYDYLIKYRKDSCDSYIYMCGAIQKTHSNSQTTKFVIMNTSKEIKKILEAKEWNKETQDKLKLRDEIHKNISDLCLLFKDAKVGIKMGLSLFTEKHNIPYDKKIELDVKQITNKK